MDEKTKKYYEDKGFFVIDATKDIGDTVICDICNDDYTDSKESGGFVFGSYAYCPKCANESLARIKSFNEEKYIKYFCGDNESFADFIRRIRITSNS